MSVRIPNPRPRILRAALDVVHPEPLLNINSEPFTLSGPPMQHCVAPDQNSRLPQSGVPSNGPDIDDLIEEWRSDPSVAEVIREFETLNVRFARYDPDRHNALREQLANGEGFVAAMRLVREADSVTGLEFVLPPGARTMDRESLLNELFHARVLTAVAKETSQTGFPVHSGDYDRLLFRYDSLGHELASTIFSEIDTVGGLDAWIQEYDGSLEEYFLSVPAYVRAAFNDGEAHARATELLERFGGVELNPIQRAYLDNIESSIVWRVKDQVLKSSNARSQATLDNIR
ncbi:MAG: hypothetical protein AAFQ82_03255 [Myxococcota bacterium]